MAARRRAALLAAAQFTAEELKRNGAENDGDFVLLQHHEDEQLSGVLQMLPCDADVTPASHAADGRARRGSADSNGSTGSLGQRMAWPLLRGRRGQRGVTRFVELREDELRIFKPRRNLLDLIRGKPIDACSADAAAAIDVRAVSVELDRDTLTLRGPDGDVALRFRARGSEAAAAWAHAIEQRQRSLAAAQRRRSRAISLGLAAPPPEAPAPGDAEHQVIPSTAFSNVLDVGAYSRDEMATAAARLLGQDPAQRNGISVLSFNLLADRYVSRTNTPHLYAHCDPGCLRWSYRIRRILRHLVRSEADLLCLQEVDRAVFERQLLPALAKTGYAGELVCNTRRSDGAELPGCATLYKTARFEPVWRERAFRSNVLGLRILTGPQRGRVIASANSHLEGNPLRSKERLGQMRSVLTKILERRRKEHDFAVLCGDFNDGAASALCRDLLQRRGMRSVYDGHAARDATCLLRPAADAVALDCEAARVDHVFSDERMRPRAVLRVMDPRWSRSALLEQGLPSLLWPSDHLSVGAVLEFCPESPLTEARRRSRRDSAARSDPFRLRSASDILQDKALNPLSEEECAKWLELEVATSYGPPESGKKLCEMEIEWRRAASKAKKDFVAQLAPEKREFVTKMSALRRREAKARVAAGLPPTPRAADARAGAKKQRRPTMATAAALVAASQVDDDDGDDDDGEDDDDDEDDDGGGEIEERKASESDDDDIDNMI